MPRLSGMIPNSFAVSVLMLSGMASALADPCGMVPPIDIPLAQQDGKPPIIRVGAQMTYVFYKNGLETFVIRPGFEGNIDNFGMLIPFPNPPEIRKVPDEIFEHIAAAIDPPEVELDLRQQFGFGGFGGGLGGNAGFGGGGFGGGLGFTIKKDEVRVIREEAVGMYEVAVLESGSAEALKKWMKEHGYRFPDGMETVCNDYVRKRWGFVAVKSRVGRKSGVDPKPGMRNINSKLPQGSSFDGHVQAMGFRFRSRRLELPMRLSAFNKGKLHNVIYLLTDDPVAVKSIGTESVVRQISGLQLKRNLLEPLPLRVLGAVVKRGRITNLTKGQLKSVDEQRDPTDKNGIARDLFESDLLAVRHNRLSHPVEDLEKQVVQISERLGLRGPEIESQHEKEVANSSESETGNTLSMLNRMTLTVIDGDFPRHVLSRKNLTFYKFKMRTRLNNSRYYDAKLGKGTEKRRGLLIRTAGLEQSILPSANLADMPPVQPVGDDAESHLVRSSLDNVSFGLPVGWTAAIFSLIVAGVLTRRRRRHRTA